MKEEQKEKLASVFQDNWKGELTLKQLFERTTKFIETEYESIQVDAEVKPACETLMKTLERVIKYYNDLQTEAPDNLSLGMLHTNMVILIEQFEEYKSKSV